MYRLVRCQRAAKRVLEKQGQKVKYECPVHDCRKHFTQYSSLQKHLRIHTGEKPYKCTHPGCNKAFTQISNLKRHQKLHTGEKPFACKICKKSYVTLSNLKQHMQVHVCKTSRDKYLCPVPGCPKTFFHKCSLNKHVQHLHPNFEFDIKTFPLTKVKVTPTHVHSHKCNHSQGVKKPTCSKQQKTVRRPYKKRAKKATKAQKQAQKAQKKSKAVVAQTTTYDAKSLYKELLQTDFSQLTSLDQLTEDCESTTHESHVTNSVHELMEASSPKRKFSMMFEDDFFATDYKEPELTKQAKVSCHQSGAITTKPCLGDYQCIDNLFNLDDDTATASLSSPG